jgi:hypothetical protein
VSVTVVVPVISVIVAITGVSLTYLNYRRTRQPELELTFQIHRPSTLINVKSEVRDDVEVTYKNTRIVDLKSVDVSIRSSGKKGVEIPEPNAQAPVTLDFGQGAQIIGKPTVTRILGDGEDPTPLDSEKTLGVLDSHTVALKPILLNPRTVITISTLLAGLKDTINVTANIRDVDLRGEDAYTTPTSGPSRALFVITFILGLFVIVLVLAGFFDLLSPDAVSAFISPIATVMFAIVAYVFGRSAGTDDDRSSPST